MDQVKARVLRDARIEGVTYKPDDIFVGDAKLVASYAASGDLDPHPDAVAYVEQRAVELAEAADAESRKTLFGIPIPFM